jgi:DNA-binding transcriptional LysR family regulator
VVQEGSFSQAAALLQLSQPAVSLQLRQLERQLGTRLIERVGRRRADGGRAGPAGAAAGRGPGAGGLEQALGSHARGVSGQVRIGTGLTVCLYLLPAVLRQVRARYPGIDIVVVTGNTEECVRRVEDNSLDLALVTLPVNRRALLATPVLRDELVAVARAGLLGAGASATAAQLRLLPLLALQKSASTRGVVDAWLRRGGELPRPQMELDSVEALKEMAAIGLGYAVLPRMAMQGRGRGTIWNCARWRHGWSAVWPWCCARTSRWAGPCPWSARASRPMARPGSRTRTWRPARHPDPGSKTPGKPGVVCSGVRDAQSVLNTSRAASMVRSMSSSLCAALTKPASYSAGAK